MKAIISFLALVSGIATAQAEVKPDGFVMTSQCGKNIANMPVGGIHIQKICLADIVGGDALTGKKSEAIVAYSSGLVGPHTVTRNTVHKIVSEKVVGAGLIEQTLQQIGFVNNRGLFQPMLATVYIESRVYKTIGTGSLIQTMSGDIAGEQFETAVFEAVFHSM